MLSSRTARSLGSGSRLNRLSAEVSCRIGLTRPQPRLLCRPLAATAPDSGHSDETLNLGAMALTSSCILLLSSPPALALDAANPFEGIQSNSLYVTLALFLMSVPGIWSQVKRAPQASKKRKTFEVDGPARAGAVPMDDRARQIFGYFKHYNYAVKEMGEVITFVGLYAANKGQAAAVTFYTFVGMGSIALVLSTLNPEVGGWWYLLTLLSPGAWFYYMGKGTRQEEIKVKMVSSDDEQTTDIIIEGDIEEINRLSSELKLVEKGMVRVKGLFEQGQPQA